LPWIVREIAQWHGINETELGNATTQTAKRFFRLPAES